MSPIRHDILALRPTQMTLGLYEVERRQARIGGLSRHELERYLDARPVPIVLGPAGRGHIVDRHHLCRALHELGHEAVGCIVQADLSPLACEEFWVFMELRGWLHPYDRHGRRRPVAELPASIDGLQDDPYRALAGCVREARGFAKVALPYVEFIWADFLRRRIPRAALADMPAAIALGIELAASPAAAHLPGTPAST